MASNLAKSSRKHLSAAIRIVIALLALGLFLKGENLKELWKVLTGLNPLVFLAAFALYYGGQFLFVLRWRLLLKVLSIDLSIWAGVKLHLLGLFYNSCLPSAVGGDLLRAWYVTKHAKEDRRFEAALSVFVDRAVGLSGMIAMACIFYWLVPVDDVMANQAPQTTEQPAAGGLFDMIYSYRIALLVVFGLVVIGLFGMCIVPKGRLLIIKVWEKLFKVGIKVFKESIAAIKCYGKRPLVVLMAYLLTFICQGMAIYGYYLLGESLGMGVAMKYYFVFFPLSWMIGVIPVSIGGLGVVEGFLKVAFESVQFAANGASAVLAVCQRLILMIGAVPGVFIHMFGVHLPDEDKQFFIDSDVTMD